MKKIEEEKKNEFDISVTRYKHLCLFIMLISYVSNSSNKYNEIV